LRYAEDSTLKLHTAPDGIVWFAEGNRPPCSSGLPVTELFTHEIWRQPRSGVRILGTPENAAMLLDVVERREALSLPQYQIAGPQVCRTRRELRDPEITLYRMRQCMLPASLGGWHIVTQQDYVTYRLHRALGDTSAERRASLLVLHPIWHPLQFVAGINPDAVAKLIGELLDPRWFVRPESPDSLSRLRRFLGLQPDVAERVSSNAADAALQRYRLVLSCWQQQTPEDIETPGNFLWRVRRTAGLHGDLRASQFFVLFLFHVWRNAVVQVSDGLFNPSVIFKRPDEMAAFRQHLASCPEGDRGVV